MGHGRDVPDLFTHEAQVREGSTTHWLPIQGSLMPAYSAEVKVGDMVELKIVLGGASGSRSVFLINSFQRLASTSPGTQAGVEPEME